MNLFLDALAWLGTPANWAGPSGIASRLLQHVGITLGVVLIAMFIAIPLGILVGHTRRGRNAAVMFAGGARAIPTLGLLTLLGLMLGIGLRAPALALVVLALPSLLAGAYSGIESVPPSVVDSAKAVGMNPWQVITKVEVPLGSPIIVGGIRAATLQVVATATLAAYTANFGLGRYIFAGLKTGDYAQMLAGALLVTLLALVFELLLALAQKITHHLATPADSASLKKSANKRIGIS